MPAAARAAPTPDRNAPLLISVAEAMRLTGLGRSKLLELAYSRQIPSVRVGSRRLIIHAGLKPWIAGLCTRQEDAMPRYAGDCAGTTCCALMEALRSGSPLSDEVLTALFAAERSPRAHQQLADGLHVAGLINNEQRALLANVHRDLGGA